MTGREEPWPSLQLPAWQDTYATLHMWMQVVGKILVAQMPLTNHCWNSALHLTVRGLSTPPMPCGGHFFDIEFDFVGHRLHIHRDDGLVKTLELAPRSVADFYEELMRTLDGMGLPVMVWPVPVEVPDPIPFEDDFVHAAYDPEYAGRFWRILLRVGRVLEEFRARFIGKCSPVHFFWGSCDLAVTRFSGRLAPVRAEGDPITREAYSHEVISHGFWPGVRSNETAPADAFDGMVHEPAFYAYAAPEPAGLGEASIRPAAAYYSAAMKEFILPYEAVRVAASPEQEILAFVESTYERAADLALWDRPVLERGF